MIREDASGPMDAAGDRRALWAGVDALVDSVELDDALRAHRLHLVAGHRRRALGLPVPPVLALEERRAMMYSLIVPALLARAREAYDGRLVLMKGSDVAARYPEPLTRPSVDVDLLADDAVAAQAALRAAGFHEVGDRALYRDIHHLRPLVLPSLPIAIEVHSRPKWIPDLSTPTEELLDAAIPGDDGIGRLPPEHHAVLLAVHAWAHAPLGRLGHLLDVAAMAASGDRADALALASRWGCARLLDTTLRASDAVFLGAGRPLALRLWARHLAAARDRTVFEGHLCRQFEPAWRVPRRFAAGALVTSAIADVRPDDDETWRRKAARARRALRSARDAKPVYDRRLGPIDPLTTSQHPPG